MTAEIAIMNKQGIALAADSAVSIGSKKVYNSANKLFALSCYHPVGIMIYGNAEFMGIPWETLVKYYRQHYLDKRNFDTVEGFANDFQKFIRTTNLFDGPHELLYVSNQAEYIIKRIRDNVIKSVKEILRTSKSITKAATKKCIDQEIAEAIAGFATLPKHDEYTPALKQKIKIKYQKTVSNTIKTLLENIPVSPAGAKLILELVLDSLGKKIEWNGSTGIVIAGFGEKQIYPAVSQFSMEGRVENYLKILKKSPSLVGLDNAAEIMPFAQREMVDTFMGGMEPAFLKTVQDSLKIIVHKIPDLLAKHGISVPSTSSAATKELDDLLDVFKTELKQIQQTKFVNPVLDSVGALPIDELAAMAEALVNLTSFKRRVTLAPESVGGPIDVAVISKGDGFIWIKRKHYFSHDLNHHFFEK